MCKQRRRVRAVLCKIERDTEARQRLAAQMPAIDKAARADYIVQTDGTLAETDAQVEEIWNELKRE